MRTISEALVDAALAVPNLDEAADAVASVVNEVYAQAGAAGRGMKDALNGTWLGHPLHPAITDVPVGAWTAALVLDLLGERRGAKIAVGVGLIGALGAALTGLTDWADTSGKPRRLGVVHAAANISATALYAASFVLRDRPGSLGVTLANIGYGLVSIGALYGGALSLDLHAGVNRAQDSEPPEDETDAGSLSEIPDGGMRRVSVNGYPVLLVRRGGEVRAIGARCSHQGGPLDEGRLDGDVVTCPWHGSRFCVVDGGIVQGPAAYPQPAFEVRIEGERVRVTPR